MDDLIAALKRRVNPEGVLDIPIRKVGSNRVEIILPNATDEQVEEVKRLITDVGSLEFHILANTRDDASAIERSRRPNGFTNPPAGFAWARLGEVATGQKPAFDATHLADPDRVWRRDQFAGTSVELRGQSSLGRETVLSLPIKSNTANRLEV